MLIFRLNTLSVACNKTKKKLCENDEPWSADVRVWKRLTVTVGISFGGSSMQLLALTQLVVKVDGN